MVKFGLIGYGTAAKCHAKAIKEAKNGELVAVSEISEEARREAKDAFGIDTYQDYKDLLKREDIDVVTIAIPNYLHHMAAIDSLNHGKHILVEKPMALTVPDCEDIIKVGVHGTKRQIRALASCTHKY